VHTTAGRSVKPTELAKLPLKWLNLYAQYNHRFINMPLAAQLQKRHVDRKNESSIISPEKSFQATF